MNHHFDYHNSGSALTLDVVTKAKLYTPSTRAILTEKNGHQVSMLRELLGNSGKFGPCIHKIETITNRKPQYSLNKQNYA
jgi:hypothetical protein